MYQSNQSFNIPPLLRHLNLWKIFSKPPTPPWAKKMFKYLIIIPFQVIICPYPQEGYQITVLTFQ